MKGGGGGSLTKVVLHFVDTMSTIFIHFKNHILMLFFLFRNELKRPGDLFCPTAYLRITSLHLVIKFKKSFYISMHSLEKEHT